MCSPTTGGKVGLRGLVSRAAETYVQRVDDVYATVKELPKRGVVFEEYDVLGVKTVDGVAGHASGARGAWFKNLDGNILQISQDRS
jgi:hypothetical protein